MDGYGGTKTHTIMSQASHNVDEKCVNKSAFNQVLPTKASLCSAMCCTVTFGKLLVAHSHNPLLTLHFHWYSCVESTYSCCLSLLKLLHYVS